MKLHEDFQRYNAFRRPEWRFDRVLKMCDRHPTPGRCTKRDDEHVRKARNFLLRWRAQSDEEDQSGREAMFWETPGLYYAYEIYERSSEYPGPALCLQARLLADQSREQIAEAMGIIPETVDWYERLFFNVSDRLKNRDWIITQVLMPALMKTHGKNPVTGDDDDDVVLPFRDSTVARPFMDGSLKLFAYFGGKFIVDMLLGSMESGKPCQGPEDVATWCDSHWSSIIRRRSAQAAISFEVNKYNVMELFAVHTRIMEIEKSADTQENQRTMTERHIKAMIEGIPWAVGEDGERLVAGTALGRYDEEAAELRDSEILLVSIGEEPESIEDRLLALPPPRKKKPTLDGKDENLLDKTN